MRFLPNPEKDLADALARGRDHVSDDILNQDGQRARKEVEAALRKSKKAKAFNRKARRRKKKGRR